MRINQALMTVEDENTQQEESGQEAFTETRLLPGDILRAARQAKGLSTADVATSLCLRQQLIEELEANKFDPKVAVTFTRGYLKSYAKHVEASEDDVLSAYHDLIEEKPQPKDMRSFSRKKTMEAHDNRLMFITYVIVAILIASVVLFFWQQSASNADVEGFENTEQEVPMEQQGEPEPSRATKRTETPSQAFKAEAEMQTSPNTALLSPERKVENTAAGEASSVVAEPSFEAEAEVEPVAEAEQQTIPTQEPEVTTNDEQNTEAQAQVAELAEPATDTATSMQTAANNTAVNRTGSFLETADPNAGELVLYFKGDSWVEVSEDGNNENILAVGTKRKGYNMPLGGVSAYTVTLGAPSAVEVYYLGERVDLSELPTNRVVPFRVPER